MTRPRINCGLCGRWLVEPRQQWRSGRSKRSGGGEERTERSRLPSPCRNNTVELWQSLGPTGSGKTTAVEVSLEEVVEKGGRVIGACPSQTSFTIFQVLTQTTFKITEHGHIHRHTHIHIHVQIRSNIFSKCIYMCLIMNRHGHNNIRNGIAWAQTGHSTGTCTATLLVVEL